MSGGAVLCFGYGFTARALARRLLAEKGWRVIGTTRSADKFGAIAADGAAPCLFNGETPPPEEAIAEATHIVLSARPADGADPVLARCRDVFLEKAARLRWIGYLSASGVYGDRDGGVVDEATPPAPTSPQGKARARAEEDWRVLADTLSVPLALCRLGGVYGPGRNTLVRFESGVARRIIRQGHVLNRIHVEDAAALLQAALLAEAGGVFNFVDDEPAPAPDVVAYAAKLLGRPAPPEIAWDDESLPEKTRRFYRENKRVSNAKTKARLGVRLLYPSYREGLRQIFETDFSGER